MKVMKKAAALLLALCVVFPALSVVVSAAQGTLMFSDPSTKVGETVEVDLVIRSGRSPIGDADVTMSYDPECLEFLEGEGVQAEGEDKLSYSGGGTGTETELRTKIKFKALLMGDTKITVDSSTAYLYSDEKLKLTEGNSVVSIQVADDGSTSAERSTSEPSGNGEEKTDIVVTVNDVQYNFSESFSPASVPSGYTEASLSFQGTERKFVKNEAEVYLGYLVDGSGTGSFFLYSPQEEKFTPYVQILISDTTSIILLDDPSSVSLPSAFQQVELSVAGHTFPAWSNPENDRFYVMYALNTRTGERSIYQYDTQDGTYQSISIGEEVKKETKTEKVPLGSLGKFVTENIVLFLSAVAAVILLLFILMVVFGVKLLHRNQELDDLYDEYDIPFDDDDEDVGMIIGGSDVPPAAASLMEGRDDDDMYTSFDDDDLLGDDEEMKLGEQEDSSDEDDYFEHFEVKTEIEIPDGKTKEVTSVKKKSGDDYNVDFIDI